MTDFGYFLSSEELSPQAIVDVGREAEQAGLDRVWVSDHFHPWLEEQGQSPFVWSVLGVLAVTTELSLTTAVTCPIMRIHPVVITQAVATTTCLAPAARIADGYINTSPDEDLLKRYRDKGGSGVSQAGTKVCWAPTEEEAIETARTTWGHSAIGGPASQELAVPEHFQPLADAATDEQIKDSVPCGPDAGQAAESIRAYVDAGFDEVYVAQMGPRQEEGLRFIVDEVLPRV